MCGICVYDGAIRIHVCDSVMHTRDYDGVIRIHVRDSVMHTCDGHGSDGVIHVCGSGVVRALDCVFGCACIVRVYENVYTNESCHMYSSVVDLCCGLWGGYD